MTPLMTKLHRPHARGLLELAALIAVLPLFLPNNFYFEVAIKIGIAAIVCVGLNLLIGYAGQISLGHAGFFGLGGYATAVLTTEYDWPSLAALTASAALIGLLAFGLARPILRLRGHYLAMATLGMGIIISITLNQEANLTGGPDGMPVDALNLAGLKVTGERSWYAITGLLLWISVWLALNLIASPMGRALRAVHGSEVAASVAGVDTARCKVLVFVVSAVFAAVAGSLFAFYSRYLTPEVASFTSSIEFVTMVVLGGMASTYGAVVGAAIVTALPQLIAGFEDWEMMVFGLILMLTMIFMPRGLVPTLAARLGRKRK